MKRLFFKHPMTLSTIIFTTVMVTLAANIAYSAIINVPADQPTIQDGINAANGGDTVRVAAGTYIVSNITLNKAITVESEGGAADTIIDCGSSGRGFSITADAVLNGFTIMNGYTSGNGAAILVEDSSPHIMNCVMKSNSAGYLGGAISGRNSSIYLANCVIVSNSVNSYGSALIVEGGTSDIINCTIIGNSGGRAVVEAVGGANLVITNTILWDNQPAQVFIQNSTLNVSYSDVQDGQSKITSENSTLNWLDGNIDADPLVVDQVNGDCHLSSNSPCINAGTATNAPTTDIEGNNRILSPDIGAYEFVSLNELIVKPVPIDFGFFFVNQLAQIDIELANYGANDILVTDITSTCGRKFLTSLCLSGYVDDKERWGIGEMGQKLQCSLLLQRSNAPMLSFTRLLP